MPRLTYAQMMGYWIKAGGPAPVAPVAAAIGEAESGGNTDAVNPNDNNGKQSSYGVWQISNGTHTPPAANWADPAENARLAVGKYRDAGNNFTPWGTYDSGAYRAYLNGSTTPDMNVQGNPGAIQAETTAASNLDCIFPSGGSISVPVIPGIYSTSISSCLITASNVRAWLGSALMLLGTAGMALALGGAMLAAGIDNPAGRALNRRFRGELGAAEAAEAAAARPQGSRARP